MHNRITERTPLCFATPMAWHLLLKKVVEHKYAVAKCYGVQECDATGDAVYSFVGHMKKEKFVSTKVEVDSLAWSLRRGARGIKGSVI